MQTGNTLPVLLPRVAILNYDTPPLFIPKQELNQLAQNMTIYSVSLKYTYNNADYIQSFPIVYVPEDKTAPLPPPPTVKQDLEQILLHLQTFYISD